MSAKLIANFNFRFRGDGSDKSIAVNLLTDPVAYSIGSGGTAPVGFGIFSSSPSGQYNVASDGGLTVDTVTLLLGVLTVTFTTAPANGTEYEVTGVLTF